MTRPPLGATSPEMRTSCGLSLRLLALHLDSAGNETWQVLAGTSPGTLSHLHDSTWRLQRPDRGPTEVDIGPPDAVFDQGRGAPPGLHEAAPHWPDAIMRRLRARHVSGAGTVAFDAGWFVDQLASAAMGHPILLLDGATKLGLTGLQTAAAILQDVDLADSLATTLLTAVTAAEWHGDGRLIGEFSTGELAEIAPDLKRGCEAAIGTGPRQVVFSPAEPMGVGLGPLVYDDTDSDSVGRGAIVGEVDPGSAAAEAGIEPGMALTTLAGLDTGALPFESVLNELDARRDAGEELRITFATAAPVHGLYAVEMAAEDTLSALSGGAIGDLDGMWNALCGDALLWSEDTTRLFLGEAGSLTCAHTDICPQLQLAHGLLGLKLLAVASHVATPNLFEDHGADNEASDDPEEATRLPTDRPLDMHQLGLLLDPDLTVAVLRPGDIAVFDSGALHLASNAADGPNAALYQGVMTQGALPRLRVAASLSNAASDADDAYAGHLFATDLLALVEQRLAER